MKVIPRPLGLLSELTHACPLHCPYCSNPKTIHSDHIGLPTSLWQQAIRQAAELGVLHCSFSGGEPLLFKDLYVLVGAAHAEGLYTNLITSAVGLTKDRAKELKSNGLDNVQISFQADTAELANSIAGANAHKLKLEAASHVKEAGLNLSLNVVLHRFNIDRLEQIARLAEDLGASRIELAHVQFYGWAFENRQLLIPTKKQVEEADSAIPSIRRNYKGKVDVLYVKSDYHDARPKACMGGWGQRYLTIDPNGYVLPCPTARSIPGLTFPNVREDRLKTIWEHSQAFEAFRGLNWMQEPCRGCEFRTVDYGGCRCQAALLAGDPTATDPVCRFSPKRHLLDALISKRDAARLDALEFRKVPEPDSLNSKSQPYRIT